jgi:hypothetical protein
MHMYLSMQAFFRKSRASLIIMHMFTQTCCPETSVHMCQESSSLILCNTCQTQKAHLRQCHLQRHQMFLARISCSSTLKLLHNCCCQPNSFGRVPSGSLTGLALAHPWQTPSRLALCKALRDHRQGVGTPAVAMAVLAAIQATALLPALLDRVWAHAMHLRRALGAHGLPPAGLTCLGRRTRPGGRLSTALALASLGRGGGLAGANAGHFWRAG